MDGWMDIAHNALPQSHRKPTIRFSPLLLLRSIARAGSASPRCEGPRHQFDSYYREARFDACLDRFRELRFCLRLKFAPDDEVRVREEESRSLVHAARRREARSAPATASRPFDDDLVFVFDLVFFVTPPLLLPVFVSPADRAAQDMFRELVRSEESPTEKKIWEPRTPSEPGLP